MISKAQVHACCLNEVDDRIERLQKLITESKKSGFEHTKSSMGDKYETDREMVSQEVEKVSMQLLQAQKLKQTLTSLNLSKSHTIIPGSLVLTSVGAYYISVGLGKLNIKADEFYAISAVSPLGKALVNQVAGAQLKVNNKTIVIKQIK